MGLFNKKRKEKNEIENRALKVNIANTALTLLRQGEDYESLPGTRFEFGYLFDIENHGTEALFKIITDKNTFYFAAQGQKILRLDFSEKLYLGYVDGFYSIRRMHMNDKWQRFGILN